jgi:RNA polymerase sigma-70 factor (ECF subfamily)
MSQQRVQHRRPARADFAPTRPRSVQQLEPVGLDLEETFVAREFLGGGAARRQRQTRFGGGFNFFEQILHGRINWVQNGFKARNAARDCKSGLMDYWIDGLLETAPSNSPLIQQSISPFPFRARRICYTWRAMPVQADPDAALMLRAKRGDRAAFAGLVDKYKQPVMNFVYRSLRDEIEAEDLAQNVFLHVYKSRGRYRQTAKFSTWLFTIARNLCLNEIRRRSRHPAESIEEAHAEHEDQPRQQYEDKSQISPPEKLLHGELAQKIEEALAELPENQRTAILLCRQDELSYEEIAEVLDCSLSATKSLIHRGRETLKEKLKPYLQTGEWSG